MGHGPGEQRDHSGIVRPRLEHRRAAAGAARFEIDDDSDMVRDPVGGPEGARARQPDLLAVGEQHDDVARGRSPGADRAQELEDGGDARAVVGAAGRAPHRVHMRHQRDGRQRAVTTGEHADQIAQFGRRAGLRVPAMQRRIAVGVDQVAAFLGYDTERPQTVGKIGAHTGIVGAGRRMRAHRDRADVDHRARGGKGGQRRRDRQRRRRRARRRRRSTR